MTDHCPEHGSLCAYTGAEASRCSTCHCRWSMILFRGYHGCEIPSVWSGQSAKARVADAAARREQAERRYPKDRERLLEILNEEVSAYWKTDFVWEEVI